MGVGSDDAFLIGLVVTICVVGVAGSVGLTVLVCFKWKQYVKLRNESQIHPSNRTRTGRRRHRIRVRNANDITHGGPGIFEPPPPYTEVDTNPLPPYTPLGLLVPSTNSRGNTRGNTRGTHGTMTPIPSNSITPQLRRNSNFTHLGTGTTNTPSVSMFTTSVGGTREPSASSNVRSTAMVHIG